MGNVSEKMTKEELLELFSKYDLVELTAMNTVLNYAKDVDTMEAETVIRKVFNDADDEVSEDYGLFMRHYTPSMSMINKKSDLLTKKEAKYLLEFANDAKKYFEDIKLSKPDANVEHELLELYKITDSLNSIASRNVIKLNLRKKE
ncbi:unknown [Clostridium sp. CAG:433]|nr:unknown [Clostridium sp. CAG:433]